jgi:hypothetical protein
MILACPNCGALYWEEDEDECVEVLEEYTDGREVTDDPDSNALLLFYCPNCDSIARVRDAEDAGRARHVSFFRKMFLPRAPMPPPARYVEAIAAGLTETAEEEAAFRLEAWRAGNDPIRDLPDAKKPLPEAQPAWWRENLRALRGLLDPQDDGQALLIAEADRELGAFQDCLLRLSGREASTEEPELLAAIKHFAERNNPFVQRVP